MAKDSIRYFVVAGSGRFPFDMLWYDSCWPVASEDASAMDKDWGANPRIAVLATHSKHAPTERCWQSFTWTVIVPPNCPGLGRYAKDPSGYRGLGQARLDDLREARRKAREEKQGSR